MSEFCKYLKEIKVECFTCCDNGVGACNIHLGPQSYYAKFNFSDSVYILRHDHQLTVETDIEVKYKTEYPGAMQAGKGPQFANEQVAKEKTLREFLEPKLPSGVRLLNLHRHYTPDFHDPEVVALHIHAHKRVEDLDEAKIVINALAEAINPEDIEAVMKGD